MSEVVLIAVQLGVIVAVMCILGLFVWGVIKFAEKLGDE